MNQSRRIALAGFALAAIAAAAVPFAVHAQAAADYPNKPVKIVVGYQAGGPTDLVARLLATQLQNDLGQPFVVENKPGAGSNIATSQVVAAAADGYTLLLAPAPIAMNKFVYKNLTWDVEKSLDPVSLVMSAPSILAVHPDVPAKDLKELIALAKKEPGKLAFASTGAGGTQHMAGEMFKQQAGIDILHVPYKGAAGALTDLIAGHVSMAFMTSVSAIPYLKEGKVRPIAVAADKRLPQLPDVPTMSEAGLPGFESDSWNGLFAPAGTPADIVAKLEASVVKAVKSPEMQERLASQGAVLVGDSSQEFRRYIRREVERWAELFKTVDVKVQ